MNATTAPIRSFIDANPELPTPYLVVDLDVVADRYRALAHALHGVALHYAVFGVDGYDSGHMWQEGYGPEVTIDDLPSGTRDIYVRFMNNDHTSIEPKTVDRIRVTVIPQ